ncbi:MAG TPA: DUF58 domain-containing protein [Candidatus Dormibacteraeota bacterium]
MAVAQLTAAVSAPPTGGLLERVQRRLGLTAGGLGLCAVVGGGWALARVTGGRTLYMVVYALAAAVAVAVVVARRSRPLEAVRSELPLRAREGQRLQLSIRLEAKRRLSSFVVEERLHPHLGPAMRLPVGSIAPGRPVEHSYTVSPRVRGIYSIGPLVAEWTDPFGLAQGEQVLAGSTRLIVHPSTELVHDRPLSRKWEDPPIRPPHTKPWPSGFEFYGMRDYVPGDDLRRVVWRAVARTGRMLVREYEQGITDQVIVVLDTDRAWHSPGEPSDTFEAAVHAAASFGARHIKDGFSVSLEANGHRLGHLMRGPNARITYLDQLAAVRLEKAPLSQAITRFSQFRRSSGHFVVITAHLDEGTAGALGVIIAAGASVLVAAMIWDESDPLTVHRATEVGAQVVELRPGAALGAVTAHSLGAGIRG